MKGFLGRVRVWHNHAQQQVHMRRPRSGGTGPGVAYPSLVGSAHSVGVGRKQGSEWHNHIQQKVHRATEDS